LASVKKKAIPRGKKPEKGRLGPRFKRGKKGLENCGDGKIDFQKGKKPLFLVFRNRGKRDQQKGETECRVPGKRPKEGSASPKTLKKKGTSLSHSKKRKDQRKKETSGRRKGMNNRRKL